MGWTAERPAVRAGSLSPGFDSCHPSQACPYLNPSIEPADHRCAFHLGLAAASIAWTARPSFALCTICRTHLHRGAMMLLLRHETPGRNQCAACGERLPTRHGRGRPARFCSQACRAAAYRRRRQELAETTPRWAGPRGPISLARRRGWERDQRAQERLRQKQRRERAQRRALREWHLARWHADRLDILDGSPAPSDEAAAACAAMATAAATCADLGVAGVDWDEERAAALQRAKELTPPRLSRAEWRRRKREEAKADAGRRRRGQQAGTALRGM